MTRRKLSESEAWHHIATTWEAKCKPVSWCANTPHRVMLCVPLNRWLGVAIGLCRSIEYLAHKDLISDRMKTRMHHRLADMMDVHESDFGWPVNHHEERARGPEGDYTIPAMQLALESATARIVAAELLAQISRQAP